MCGLAGLVARAHSGAPDQARFEGAAGVLRHRGPDDFGLFVDERVAIAQTRLSIIGLDDGAQPLWSDDGRIGLVANGEIYNHVELRAELEPRGHRFRTHSDCEALVHAYREHGPRFLEHVRGMFALALYDRDAGRVLLARDRLGIKPLFVREDAAGTWFGSEPKALLALAAAVPRVEPGALAQFLMSNFSTGRETPIAGIERVLPGEALWVGARGVERRWRYWSLDEVRVIERGEEEAAEELEALLAEVCREHLRSDVPIGLFLSGGSDSSALLALAAEHGARPPHCFTVGFPEASVANETVAAAETARRFGAEHTVLELDRETLLARLPDAVWAADELMADYANLPTLVLAETARAHGLKVVWSGEGGDEVFAGYGRYRMRGPRRWTARRRAPDTAGFRAKPVFDSAAARRVLSPALCDAARAWRAPYVDAWNACPAEWSELQRMQAVDIATWLPDDLLVKTDRMLMAHSVEGRVPFLDHRVVEFGLSLPDRLKCDVSAGKLLLKRWAGRRLGRERLDAHKRGFTVPVREWLAGEFGRALVREVAACAPAREWLAPEAVDTLVAQVRRRGADAPAAWALAHLVRWLDLAARGFPRPAREGSAAARRAAP